MKKLILTSAALAFVGTAHAGIMVDILDAGVTTTNVVDATVVDFDTTNYVDFGGSITDLGGTPGYEHIVKTSGVVTGYQPEAWDTAGVGSTDNKFWAVPDNGNWTNEWGVSEIKFGKSVDYFGMFWGSIDTWNWVEFYLDGALVDKVGGGELLSAMGKASNENGKYSRYVNFFSGDQLFDTVLMKSKQAFETDNHAFAMVSEPATFAILGLGLAGLVASRRRTA